jgi:hypothetical protein
VGCASTVIFGGAHAGWMPDVIQDEHYAQVGGTSNIANLGAAGLFATLIVVLVRTLPPVLAACLLSVALMAPTLLLFFIPLPARPTRAIRETFDSFFHDLWQVCRRPGCILGLVCFVSPVACFALTNIFSSLGTDFHASEKWVTALNGTAVAGACSLGCLAGIWICGRYRRRTVYVVTGMCAASAALALIGMPHTLLFYVAGVLTYNFFQGASFTALTSFEFEIVGPGNPLAGTQISLLTAAACLPVSYMTVVDGYLHTTRGLAGMLAVDGVASIAAGTALLLVFRQVSARRTALPLQALGG